MILPTKLSASSGTAALTSVAALVVAAPLASCLLGANLLYAQILDPARPLSSFKVAIARPAQLAQRKPAAASATDSAPTTAYTPTMTFEVASVRESKPDMQAGFRVSGSFAANSSIFHLENNGLMNLVIWAYGVDPHQIEGIPKDFRWRVFNVEAKADHAADQRLATLTTEQQQLEQQHMVQVLLAERFNFKAHWETRDSRTYNLIVAKSGRLKSTGAAPSPQELKAFGDRPIPPVYQQGSSMHGFEYIAHGATTADIARMLSQQFGAPVTDKTALTGKYDFDLKTYQTRSSDRAETETNPWAPLEVAIQDQLGLKLVPSHGPVRILVIDHVDLPTEN